MKDEEKDRWIQEIIEKAILKACLVNDQGLTASELKKWVQNMRYFKIHRTNLVWKKISGNF